ncbi:MAG TPA: hypothetical protein VL595_15795 [Pseudonocardia sp.]|jgi:hypothetical protein|nr:hypothetical protein [Pseudonocardia sp.]
MKKIIIVSAAAAVAMFGAAGVAYAGDDDQSRGDHNSSHHSRGDHDSGDRSSFTQGEGSTNCTSDDNMHQSNKGRQVIGGNLGAQDIAGNVAGGQSTRPAAICPSVLNNNHL